MICIKLSTRNLFAQLLSLISISCLAGDRVTIGNFSSGKLEHWKEEAFKGRTHYQIVEENQIKVLRARSQASGSGLFREITVDLTKTPILNWSWRVKNSLRDLDEHTKTGDDYVARIYIVVSGGLAFWNTRSLNYVWAANMPVGSAWPNAFAKDNVVMIAIQSGNNKAGQWHQEQRNIRVDFKRYFGKDIESISAVAIMTDTDNSGQNASAWYGDIFFSSE